MLLEDLVGKVCASLEGKLLGEDEGVVTVKEKLIVRVRIYGSKGRELGGKTYLHGGWK